MNLFSRFLRLPFLKNGQKIRLEPRDEPELAGDPLEPEPEGQLRNDAQGPNILVLDANEEMRKHYASYLGQYYYGYRVIGAVEELEPEMGAQLPDLVILDHRPPQIAGFSLASSIKESYPELPVLLCTMHGTIADYEEFGRSKADKFLIKPIRKEDLDRVIRESLARVPKKGVAASAEADEEPKLPAETAPPTQSIPAKRKPGRRRTSFIDDAEALHKEFLDSKETREDFGKKHRMSVSKLQNEIRLAQMPDEVKKLVREEPSFYKKSFFEHLLKLKNKAHLIELCLEIRQQGMQGNFYNLETVKARVAEFLALEREPKHRKALRPKDDEDAEKVIPEEVAVSDGRPDDD